MKPRAKPMVQQPYAPEQPAVNQHAVVRTLGPGALTDPALMAIVDAANEIAAEAGTTADRLTDEQVARAIALGRERHARG
ncbi:hypothetical protein [Streptomyces sp. NPDC059788]|uniref:hypothetical protein n=1 Tax=Streptomyces sp. NPDC059788 TaxID=3346948 RepID=UPI003656B898